MNADLEKETTVEKVAEVQQYEAQLSELRNQLGAANAQQLQQHDVFPLVNVVFLIVLIAIEIIFVPK